MKQLLKEIERFSETYQFSFQFWGKGRNHVYISKNFVELFSSGENETPEDAIRVALEWCNKVNPKRKK